MNSILRAIYVDVAETKTTNRERNLQVDTLARIPNPTHARPVQTRLSRLKQAFENQLLRTQVQCVGRVLAPIPEEQDHSGNVKN